MIDSGTLLICEKVLERYLTVMGEHPEAVTATFRAMVADALSDVQRERQYYLLGITRAVRAVPTETDRASLFL